MLSPKDSRLIMSSRVQLARGIVRNFVDWNKPNIPKSEQLPQSGYQHGHDTSTYRVLSNARHCCRATAYPPDLVFRNYTPLCIVIIPDLQTKGMTLVQIQIITYTFTRLSEKYFNLYIPTNDSQFGNSGSSKDTNNQTKAPWYPLHRQSIMS